MPDQPTDEKIISFMTKTAFLHFMDATEIGKVKIFAGTYRRGEGAQQTARHYLDLDTFRPILHDLSWGKAVSHVDYKGNEKDGKPESRVLKLNCKDEKVFWRLECGPGAVIGEGAVKPAGEPTTVVTAVMTKQQAREIAYDILEFLTAVRTKTLLGGIAKTGGQPKVTIEQMIDELGLPDLDGDVSVGAPKPVTPKALIDPLQAYAQRLYLNGQAVTSDYQNEYAQFTQQTGKPPTNERMLMDWIMR